MSVEQGNGSVCGRIIERTRAEVGRDRFDRCFGCAHFELGLGALQVGVPNEMYAKWLSGKFESSLLSAARCETGDAGLRIDWRVEASASEPAAPAREEVTPRPALRESSSVEPAWVRRYSLDEFVVGDSNRLALAMAKRMADPKQAPPAKSLFVHGECGVGKTHLLSGLASAYRAACGHHRVRYMTGEDFTNEYIAAVRGGRIEEFRASQRRLDLLCIDDVHFIAGKSGTKQEFLHTFDSLDLTGGRVALASDAGPREIEDFGDRLASRAAGGMVVEIRPPEEGLRNEIISRLAASRGLVLDSSAVAVLSLSCAGSVRDLNGTLNRLQALVSVMPEALGASGTVAAGLARRALLETGGSSRIRKPLRVAAIAEVVCRALGVDPEDIRKRKRHRRVVQARSWCAYLARELTTQSYPEIAEALGCGSHSTMIEGHGRIRALVERGDECEGEAIGSVVGARELYERLKRLVLNTSPTMAGL